MKRLIISGLAALALLGVVPVIPAQAMPDGMGCERIRWGFLGYQRRDICDGPRRPDGSWERTRMIFTPAGYVSAYSSCGYYSCSYHPGYYREETVQGFERYIVFPSNVLPDEPGWLPTGSVVIR
jgi:hypothetical protein